MGDLREQLNKAKLLSTKDARRLAHEERVHRKKAGREGLEQEAGKRRAELEQIRSGKREEDRRSQAELEAERKQRDELAACDEILACEVRAPARGQARWHFELADGRLPILTLSESERNQIQGGQLCIALRGPSGSHTYGLLATPLAQRVHALLPERIVWSSPPL